MSGILDKPVKRYAVKGCVVVEEGGLWPCMALMVRKDIKRLLVMKGGKLVGVLTMRLVVGDLVKKATSLADLEPLEGVRCHTAAQSSKPTPNNLNILIESI